MLADRIRLEQVLVNLLQNALDALGGQPGGRITLALRDQGERVQLYFHDNGPGLSAEALAGLFTPFHTTKPEGLGLGLVISATSSPNSAASCARRMPRTRSSPHPTAPDAAHCSS